jgi:DNA-binding MarR family transcriptional regulator
MTYLTRNPEGQFMKLFNDCIKRIQYAYTNGGLRSHAIFPIFMYLADKTGYSTTRGQFVNFTIKKLAAELKISSGTVCEALQELVDIGIIYKSRYGYAFIENMAHKGDGKNQAQLAATRKQLQEEQQNEQRS